MTEPKPLHLRPGVHGICRNGFWTPPLEYAKENKLWYTNKRTWFVDGRSYSGSQDSGWDIIGIVEDLPTVPNQKPAPSNAPIYAVIYPGLATIARQHGYALAVHGSLQRDFDLVAVPWTEHPSEPDVVVKEFTTKFDLRVVGDIGHKLHHRTVYSISLSGNCAIDLSFMPTVPSPPQGGEGGHWRLLEPGEVIQHGDEIYIASNDEWQKVIPPLIGTSSECTILRRRIAPQVEMMKTDPGGFKACAQAVDAMRKQKGHWVPAEHYVPPAEFAKLKEDAAKWREHVAKQGQPPELSGWKIVSFFQPTRDVPACSGDMHRTIEPTGEIHVTYQRCKSDDPGNVNNWTEHQQSPQPAPQIPGMPEGWEVSYVLSPDVWSIDGSDSRGTIEVEVRRSKPPEPVADDDDEIETLYCIRIGDETCYRWWNCNTKHGAGWRDKPVDAEWWSIDEIPSQVKKIIEATHGTPPELSILSHPIPESEPPEPVCTYPLGVLKDGWLCEDEDGELYWHEDEPVVEGSEWVNDGEWSRVGGMLNPPKFRDDLPWDQRIVKVGPEAEASLMANSSIDHSAE